MPGHSKKLRNPGISPAGQAFPFWEIALGAWLGLLLLKAGNPVVLSDQIQAPTNLAEFIWATWPVTWATLIYLIPLALCTISILTAQDKEGFGFKLSLTEKVLLSLPAAWLAWQCLAAMGSVDTSLTRPTLIHFATLAGCFYVTGLTARFKGGSVWFFIALAPFFLIMIRSGWNQHFGGLAATREWFFSQPDWQSYPRDYIDKLSSERIFGTLVYPNALAQAILIWCPPLTVCIWSALHKWSNQGRLILGSILPVISLACLYWSQSKAGWLVCLGMIFVISMRLPFSKKIKWLLAASLIVVGLTAFFVRYADYFNKGATSVGARMDYWSAAWTTAKENPWTGTGPGTFMRSYAKIKPHEAEMARLTHNDYLQQASDSGWPGFLLYLPIFPLGLVLLWKKVWANHLHFAAWLGLLAWACQSAVEFGLYIPALSCAAFCILGWLWGVGKTIDISPGNT